MKQNEMLELNLMEVKAELAESVKEATFLAESNQNLRASMLDLEKQMLANRILNESIIESLKKEISANVNSHRINEKTISNALIQTESSNFEIENESLIENGGTQVNNDDTHNYEFM
jgi:hypothetical protein